MICEYGLCILAKNIASNGFALHWGWRSSRAVFTYVQYPLGKGRLWEDLFSTEIVKAGVSKIYGQACIDAPESRHDGNANIE